MIPFATPDFGTGAFIGLLVLIVWAGVLLGVAAGVVCGLLLLGRPSPGSKKFGVVLIAASASVPFFCCLAPPQIARLTSGHYPIGAASNDVREGMTKDEVTRLLGTPYRREEQDDGERWYYYCDSFQIIWHCVHFGPDGRVNGGHGN